VAAVLLGLTAVSVGSTATREPVSTPSDPQQTAVTGRVPVLQVDFGSELGQTWGGGSPVEVGGAAHLSAHVIARGAGHVLTVPGLAGRGAAARFAREGEDSVAIVVTPGPGSALTAGTANFTYGADFSADGNWADGNNLVERGLFTDPGQYKLEIDGGRPTCTIKGTAGRVTARLDPVLQTGAWYSGECVRNGSAVTVTVRELGGGTGFWTRTVQGEIGDVQPAAPTTVLSIGAKTWPNDRIGVDCDQFFGAIDNVFVRFD